ncbi:GNAT family N-acetyltransferase [Arthrobacter sp. CAN_A1]|uniref:GNAT family N-acetyltransferase n=1 Tax=Arthrobacter sp. CAN_A1 TaxID=2787717 RepID=UPI002FCEEE96
MPWITRFVCVTGMASPIGLAGFHGAPNDDGMAEVGYRIDPAYRRKGYARRALEILLAVAQAQPEVRTVRATISPENIASRTLIEAYGFQAIGEQWDECQRP